MFDTSFIRAYTGCQWKLNIYQADISVISVLMAERRQIRVVLDTNVVFEGLTRRQGSCGLLINACLAGQIRVYVTDALVYEYMDVLSLKLSMERWERLKIALATVLTQAEFVTVRTSWRPASPDPGDDLVIDCAMNANALVVTSNVRDFRLAQRQLGLRVMMPLEFLRIFSE